MSNEKVVKFKRRRTPRVGLIIFFIIFIYMVVNVVIFYNKDHLAMYEVQAEDMAEETVFTGIAVREEALVYTDRAGYISCYVSDKNRVSKGMPVYSVDENNLSFDLSSGNSEAAKLEETEILELKNLIYSFREDFCLTEYSLARDFKDELGTAFNELIQLKLFDEMQKAVQSSDGAASHNIMQSNVTGVISYQSDSLLGLSLDEVNAGMFNLESYTTSRLRTSEFCNAGTPVYRIVTSESWNIVVNIDEEFYLKNLETQRVRITVLDDGYSMTAPAEFIKKGDIYIAVISLDDCMVRYIDKRFLSVEFESESAYGLKIPLSAIAQEDFFVIPNQYFKSVEGYASSVIVKENFDVTSGEVSYTYLEPTVYYNDGTSSYIDTSLLEAGSYIFDSDSGEELRVTQVDRLEGVYNVNKGYAVFRRIERISENDDYCIIKKNTSYGVSLYDHIALDAKMLDNAALIY